eukprot:TRINITY_DN25963_c0_g1_i1.p1 TRINITY_DN25963_c0_g1~~TRINITY_DN25963_c0_g1_i1.p1  ORF type:complete len:209 (-),score=35.23 TRINITY_DN25963_c0_g1_i1:262-888(-)
MNPAGEPLPGDSTYVMNMWSNSDASIVLMASVKPTSVEHTAACLEHMPDKSTLILSGTHGESYNGADCFTDAVILGNGSWSLENHADGHLFYHEDQELFERHYPDVPKDASGVRSFDGEDSRHRPGQNWQRGSQGFLRTIAHFYKASRNDQYKSPQDKVHETAANIADFCRQRQVEKIVVAFCFGAENPVVRAAAKMLGIRATIITSA